MNAELIFNGLLVLLVLWFIADIVSSRSQIPKPKPVPQKRKEPEEGAEAAEAPQEAPAEAKEAPAKAPEAAPEIEEAPPANLLQRMREGLGKTRGNLTEGLANLFAGQKAIDRDLLEEVENLLLTADVGMTATTEIVESLTAQLERSELKDADALFEALKKELRNILEPCTIPLEPETEHKPFVILMVGVNGVGKTTTIGKLARRFQRDGKSVMMAAGDTFRAAAVEQLQAWGDRIDVPVVAQHTGSDSASVVYDALQSAQAKGTDVLIADTAGRLQNKENLMNELEKVVRVMKKLDENAPHEVMLVLDAGTGQNALSQAQVFQEAVGVSGVTLTKLDGTAKGGIIFAVARQLNLPIRYIGVGETVDDLRPFAAEDFVQALFEDG
jgi:fused signal recognition particle receptor